MSPRDPARPEPLLVLCGPTAVGKTDLAIALCRRFGAEVVGADSVQVYRGLDLGSAKPTPEERALAPHHLIDVADPGEAFDAARFAELADLAIQDIRARGKRVLVAGGTGLYLRALLHGLVAAPPPDPGLRAELQAAWLRQGPAALHARLAGLDPAAARRLHQNDRQRVLRALEVCLQTGRPLSQAQAAHGFAPTRHAHVLFGLTRPRGELNRRIEARCRRMWGQGLVAEVRALLAGGLSPAARCLGSLGYRQALAVLRGELDEDAALAAMIKDTKAYAKRQQTFFRGLPGLAWLPADDPAGLIAKASETWQDD